MAYIKGFAFTADEKEESTRRYNRYKELIEQGFERKDNNFIKWERTEVKYGRNTYRGELLEGSPTITDMDLAILCDSGNTCFGASVDRTGRKFKVDVSTD